MGSGAVTVDTLGMAKALVVITVATTRAVSATSTATAAAYPAARVVALVPHAQCVMSATALAARRRVLHAAQNCAAPVTRTKATASSKATAATAQMHRSQSKSRKQPLPDS